MSITGYSDRINHALAFAAKHHDRQVRKGTRLPYLTHPANVAIILTRYGRDEQRSSPGFCTTSSRTACAMPTRAEMLEQRIGDKFGGDVLDDRARGDVRGGSTMMASSSRTRSVATTISSGWRRRATRHVGCARPTSCTTRARIVADLRRTIEPDNDLGSVHAAGKRRHRALVPPRLRPAERGRLYRRDHGASSRQTVIALEDAAA